MPAARSASRSSLWHRYLEQAARRARKRRARGSGRRRTSARGAIPPLCRRHERLVSRPALQRATRSQQFLDAHGYRGTRVEPAALAERVAALHRRRESRRPVPGPDGVRAARARRPLDHRRRALAEDAVGDEPEDQVPRVVPAVRAGGAARARRATGSSSTATARTCCSSPTFMPTRRLPPSAGRRHALGHRAAERAAVDDSGGHARRLLGAHPDGAARDEPALLRHHRAPSTAAPAARSSSTRRSTSAASRSSARPKTPTAASCAPNMDVLVLENFILVKDEQKPRRGRRELAQGVRARLKPRSSGDCLRALLRRADSRTMIVRSSTRTVFESRARRRISAIASSVWRSTPFTPSRTRMSRTSSSSRDTEYRPVERDQRSILADRHELNARQLLERLDRNHHDNRLCAVIGELRRTSRDSSDLGMTLEHRHNRLPQIGVDRAETRDDIFRQRDRHRPGWPSELWGPAAPPFHQMHWCAFYISPSGRAHLYLSR